MLLLPLLLSLFSGARVLRRRRRHFRKRNRKIQVISKKRERSWHRVREQCLVHNFLFFVGNNVQWSKPYFKEINTKKFSCPWIFRILPFGGRELRLEQTAMSESNFFSKFCFVLETTQNGQNRILKQTNIIFFIPLNFSHFDPKLPFFAENGHFQKCPITRASPEGRASLVLGVPVVHYWRKSVKRLCLTEPKTLIFLLATI